MFKTNGYETINDERRLIIINYNVFIKRGDRNIKENTIEMCILLVEFYFISEFTNNYWTYPRYIRDRRKPKEEH